MDLRAVRRLTWRKPTFVVVLASAMLLAVASSAMAAGLGLWDDVPVFRSTGLIDESQWSAGAPAPIVGPRSWSEPEGLVVDQDRQSAPTTADQSAGADAQSADSGTSGSESSADDGSSASVTSIPATSVGQDRSASGTAGDKGRDDDDGADDDEDDDDDDDDDDEDDARGRGDSSNRQDHRDRSPGEDGRFDDD